jgi:hypothetical protein
MRINKALGKDCTMTTENSEFEKRGIPERMPPDVLPPGDRGEDEVREAIEEGMALGESRPLTRAEREAAARDPGISEPVYAPASERVSKEPAPGDEKFVGCKEGEKD